MKHILRPSADERTLDIWLVHIRRYRQILFYPWIAFLAWLGLTHNMVTFFRIIVIVPMAYFLIVGLAKVAMFCVILGLLSDLFDGDLSRFLKRSSDRGKFLDMLADHVLYGALILGTAYTLFEPDFPFAYHLFIIPITYVLAIIAKQEGRKTDWIIKPQAEISYIKFLGYGSVFLYVYDGRDLVLPTMVFLNIIGTCLAFYFITVIVRRFMMYEKALY